jgi:hypothetical protein
MAHSSLLFGDIGLLGGTWIVKVLGDLCDGVIFIPRDLVRRSAVAGRRGDVPRHSLGKFRTGFRIFTKVILI